MIPAQYLEPLVWEQILGDPDNPDNLLSFRHAIALDEADAFPEEAVSRLLNSGLHYNYVPEHLGGRFRSSETFVALGRVLARRNMSVAVSCSTMLWTVLAWIGATKAQQERIAEWLLQAGEFPCLAYSESEHGADLAANELVACRNGQGNYHLTGEKWPINRATRSGFLVLLARTDTAPHLRNHSLFIINKRDLDCSRYYHLPPVKTHGLRGCDISGIGFRDCALPADALVGAEGAGLELALKGFQVTRTFCTALSLGVGDSALRLVTDFAIRRKLYDAHVADLPHAREVLANAYLSQLIGECASIVAARGLHLYPRQYCSWSSIAKVQVTRLVDHACGQLAAILGARYYMRERHHDGMFQKILRDGAIVSVFDGSSVICLDSLATLLPGMARSRRQVRQDADYSSLYNLLLPLPALPFDQLDLFGRGRDAVTESLPDLIKRLQSMPDDALSSNEVLPQLRAQALALQAELTALEDDVLANPPQRGARNTTAQFARAERFCALHSAIACLGIWLFNRHYLGSFFADGRWLLAALMRRGDPGFRTGSLSTGHTDALAAQLLHQFNAQQMFSLLPWKLAERNSAETLSKFNVNRSDEAMNNYA
jgi:alkylation response protein AidB-like acyl-CoA dehydrogenase